jgi:sugar lactone lactonase YvrE
VYVFHNGKPSVIKFDRDGNYLASWGDDFENAHGFYMHRENGTEYLYVTDTKRGLMTKYTTDGEALLTLGVPDLPDVYDAERKYCPTDVCVAPGGDIYIADGYGQSWIHQYNAKGGYIRSWGGKGAEPGRLNCPHGISVNLRGPEPELYVADRANSRIQVFTMDGQHKRFIVDDMDRPCSFYFDGKEMFFPDLHSRVTIFDGDDRLITHLGEDQQAYKQEGWPNLPAEYFRPNKFSSPHGVCVDSQHNVYVVEWTRHGRITKLIRK